ncbi:phosphopantetheine-binding protein [Streptomyces sp. M19]
MRIEPGEVEAAVEAHPDVASCCALRVETAPGRPELACLYTTVTGAPVAAEELRGRAARVLVGAMVPTVLTHTDRLRWARPARPTRPPRRVVAAALAPRPRPRPALVAHPVADASEPGRADGLLVAAGELLGRPALGEDDDLIAAGATSLDVVRLAARTGSRFGARVTVGDVYRLRTVARLRRYGATAPPAEDETLPGRRPTRVRCR